MLRKLDNRTEETSDNVCEEFLMFYYIFYEVYCCILNGEYKIFPLYLMPNLYSGY
jgi:hypothetical protein